ncbi:MAG TPA: ABC transporter ATP-binding protein [Anaerolineaceae bacterium]|jgi:oligopeptide/dipeptide ABC transporter ATP-binding protein
MVENEKDLLVSIKDLRTYFYLAEGVVRAVDGVDLDIHRRETMGIVGESGCGKSIMSLSLLNLVPQPGKIISGDILYYRAGKNPASPNISDVINITKLDPNGREIREIRGNQISMVFQEPMTAMIPVRTIGEQITEVITLHQKVGKAEAREKAIEMLARVRMPKPERVIDDYPFQLSGGMRQRAVIAMGLSCRPNLLIADEPTTALDVTTEAQILNLMRDLQQEFGMAIMYITHNLGVIAEMADNVAVMYLGKVVEQTDVNSIFFNPLHPYTTGLLASIPQLSDAVAHIDKRRLNVIKGMVPDPYSRIKGCPFHPRCPQMISGVCDQEEPKVIQKGPNHLVRCHLYN